MASAWNEWKLFPDMPFLIKSYTWIKIGKLHAVCQVHFLSKLNVYKHNVSKK